MPDPAVVVVPNGPFVENCYLVADEASGEAAIVDPGADAERFLALLDERGWRCTGIWLTHAHIDHVQGVGTVHEATGAPIHLHPLDRPLYDNLPQQAGWFGGHADPAPEPQVEWADGDEAVVGAHRFTVRHAPGHTPGHVVLLGHGVALVGDVLFQGSVGRVDLPGGHGPTLIESIERVLLPLDDATVVHPGHGPRTTIGAERRDNPFLTGRVVLT